MTFGVDDIVHDRYRIVRKLGEGGMGAVYEVEHVQLGRKLALKTLHPELTRSADVVARFHREARAAAMVGSPHIVDVVDLGTADGNPYIVMEYLEGGSLRALLEELGQLQITRALTIVTQCCRALGTAHAKGIVHRDLKPDNIMLVDRDGADFVKIVDFGIAKLVEDSIALDAVATTRTGITMGTPQYMSPEQIAGESDIDARADVWAMGAVLFELLTGRPPFEANTMPMLAAKIHSAKTPSPRDLRPGLPARLDAIVQRALAKAREDRFAAIGDLGAAIEALKMSPGATTQRPAGAFPFDEETRIDTAPAGARTSSARVSTTPRAWDVDDSVGPRGRRRVGLVVGLGALGVVLASGTIALAIAFGDPDTRGQSATTLASLRESPASGTSVHADDPQAGDRASLEIGQQEVPQPAVMPLGSTSPPEHGGEPTARVERRLARPRITSPRQGPTAGSSPSSAESPPPEPATAETPRATGAELARPSPRGRRVSIRNSRQLAVAVTLTCGEAAPVNVRVAAGTSRAVSVEDGVCRVRCDDGVSVGSLCGTRLPATAGALVIR